MRRALLLSAVLLAPLALASWTRLFETEPRPGVLAQGLHVVDYGPLAASDAPESASAADLNRRTVTRVIDGDTLVLDGGERVRLIGVDTPETVHPSRPVEHFGREASAFTKRMAEGQEILLEYEEGSPSQDRYGRTLAYVYLRDGTLLNKEIIEHGYGHAYTRFPFSKMEEFRAAERRARSSGRGLWGTANSDLADEEPSAGPRTSAEAPSSTVRPAQQSQCIPPSQCCRVCSSGKACGDSCISSGYTCRKERGCACDRGELC